MTQRSVSAAALDGALLASAQIPDVGQQAPEFSLSTLDGQSLSLSSFTRKGTVVLIVLRGYPGYRYPYFTKQVHDFVENADKFRAMGAQVLLVYPGPSADLDQSAREALARQNPLPGNVHLVTDPDYTFTHQYGLGWDAPQQTAYPSMFLIDGKDVVFYRRVGHGDRTTALEIITRLQSREAGH